MFTLIPGEYWSSLCQIHTHVAVRMNETTEENFDFNLVALAAEPFFAFVDVLFYDEEDGCLIFFVPLSSPLSISAYFELYFHLRCAEFIAFDASPLKI